MAPRIGLTRQGRRLLADLRVALTSEDLASRGLGQPALQALLAAGLVETQSGLAPPQEYQDAHSGWRAHKGMLIDDARTLAFQRAIEAAVRPGDYVIDVGTGSGILSMFAARAGAGKVHALEYTSMADWAERLAVKNGLNAMQVIRGDAADYQGEGQADVVMGEFAGMWLIEEWWHYAAFVKLRDRLLKPGGRVVPQAARLFLSAVDSRKLHYERGWGFFDQPVYGFDFSEVLRSGAYRPARYILSAEWKSLVSTQEIARFDYLRGNERDYLFSTEVQFPYPVGGMFHGFIGHFDLDLAPGQVLSTSCGVRETHWHQSYFPMPAHPVAPGQAVVARLRCFLDEEAQALNLGITIVAPGESQGSQDEHVFALA